MAAGEGEELEVHLVRSFDFLEPADQPSATVLVLAGGRDGGPPHHRFLVSREILERMAAEFHRKAKTMPHTIQ